MVKFPFVKDPASLPYNKSQIVKMAAKLERRLKQEGLLESYNKEFQKYIDRKTFVPVTKLEQKNY